MAQRPLPGSSSAPRPAERRLGAGLVMLGAVLIGGLTLVPNPHGVKEAAATPFACMLCGEFDGVDIVLNVALFLPLGLGLGLLGVRIWRAVAIMVLTTCAVELLQATVILGRDSSLRDILTNTLGGILGFGLAHWWYQLAFPTGELSRKLATGALGAWTLWWIGAALLLQVAPPPLPWWGQLAVPGVMSADFPGHLIETRFDGRVMPDNQIANADSLERNMRTGHARIDIVALAGGATPALAPLFGVLTADHKEVLLVGQAGSDLVFRTRRRSAEFRLHAPTLRLEGGAWQVGDTIRVRAELDQDEMILESQSASGVVRSSLVVGPSVGWTLWLPGDFAFDSSAVLFSMIWIFVSLLPAVYWGSRANRLRPGRNALWWGGVVLALALALVVGPITTGTATGSLSELVAALLALGAGAILAARSVERAAG